MGYEKGFKRYGKKSNNLIKKAVNLAEKADILLVYIGLDEESEAEGIDRSNMRLPKNQCELLTALRKTGKKIVGVLSCGCALETEWDKNTDALLYGSLGGQASASAMLNVITGKTVPSGKLSESFPYKYEHCSSAANFLKGENTVEYREGIFVGYRYYEKAGIETKYPFGYGLSYTDFEYSDIKINDKGASFSITNTGNYDGSEIAQMYIGINKSDIFRPLKELKGFKKIFIKKGETKKVEINFDEYSFRFYNVRDKKWDIEKATYQIYIGSSSNNIKLQSEINKDGISAVGIYNKAILPSYFLGTTNNVSTQEFENLINKKVPEPSLNFVKKNRIIVDYNTATNDLKYSKGWSGRFYAGVLRFGYNFLKLIGQRKTANTMMISLFSMPLRGLSRMTGGMISQGQLDGLIIMFNGKFFKGVTKFFKEGRKKKIRIKNEKALQKLEEQKNKNVIKNEQVSENIVQKELAASTVKDEINLIQSSKNKNIFIRTGLWFKKSWIKLKEKHPNIAQFLVFFILSNGVTILQIITMPMFRAIFENTTLISTNFQVFRVGSNLDGSAYYIFNYAAGLINSDGTGGGLAYFLAVQISLAIAQIINFFAQRNITFKHTGNAWYSAMWYVIAYIAITLVAGAAQGFYKAPIYSLFMRLWGSTGESFADVLTMIINAAISFWIFFPIFKVIFKNKKNNKNS
jgi:hypothetical protein